ncbi:hypothetical protein [Phyllobacterium sp. YR620]|uniref:hypothetical protein n=1 Tax=Phyllobacterium sp. YR620 TaxID=1881066 RepID=UPI0015873EAE|nr:hypothetical protein [Phyllobacterium sp. YR620]
MALFEENPERGLLAFHGGFRREILWLALCGRAARPSRSRDGPIDKTEKKTDHGGRIDDEINLI